MDFERRIRWHIGGGLVCGGVLIQNAKVARPRTGSVRAYCRKQEKQTRDHQRSIRQPCVGVALAIDRGHAIMFVQSHRGFEFRNQDIELLREPALNLVRIIHRDVGSGLLGYVIAKFVHGAAVAVNSSGGISSNLFLKRENVLLVVPSAASVPRRRVPG
jgi:hypothetical protein